MENKENNISFKEVKDQYNRKKQDNQVKRNRYRAIKKAFIHRIIFFLAIVVLTLLVTGFFGKTLYYFYLKTQASSPSSVLIHENKNDRYMILDSEVTAVSAIIFSLSDDQILYGKNIDTLLPIASIAKLLSGLVAYEYLHNSDVTEITTADLAITGHTPLSVGDFWNAKDLLEYSLITSSNRGIHALARMIEKKTGNNFTQLMNEKAEEIGLNVSYFVNPTGLDVHENISGSESSVRDIVILMKAFLEEAPELAEVTTLPLKNFYTASGKEYIAVNTNKKIDAGYTFLLSKTGFTTIAGGGLAVVANIGKQQDIAIAVLGSTALGRFDDVETLISIAKERYAKN